MSRTIRNAPLVWFQRVLWLGIVANLGLAVPTLVVPERMLAIFSLPAATPLMWPRFAAWLLILLSAFYVPAALDPDALPDDGLAGGGRASGGRAVLPDAVRGLPHARRRRSGVLPAGGDPAVAGRPRANTAGRRGSSGQTAAPRADARWRARVSRDGCA